MSDLPKQARAVVVGGGIVGCSVAYHLAELGWTDLVLVEQSELAGGTSWHAAGMVGRLRTSNALTRINDESAQLYSRLHEMTGVDVGWNQCGSLMVASSAERMTQLRRTAAMARVFDVEAHLLGPSEAAKYWPLIRVEDLHGGVWLPHDGKLDPKLATQALAKAARDLGVAVHEGVRVEELLRDDDRVLGVRTEQGELRAEHVVLCGGMWTRQLGLPCGVRLPLWPVEHHYAVTAPIDGVHHDLPNLRDPDAAIYIRADGDQIMLGAFQEEAKPWDVPRVPDEFSFQLLEPDWPKFARPLETGRWRLPALEGCDFERFVNGPESFTPDNNFLLGETPESRNLWVAAGFNSAGIACAGGAGKALARWMAEGDPGMDLWSVDVRRFTGFHNDEAFLRGRVTEVLGLHYRMAWPNLELSTSRGVRRSALHERLREAGAHFGSKMGWERPNWFAPGEIDPPVDYSFGRQNWFQHHGREHRAAREAVAVFDQSSFSKLLVQGPDAARALQWICGADVDVEVGRAVYTGLFNERGTFESDLSLIRQAEDRYLVITATTQTERDADWIRRQIPAGCRLSLEDHTERQGVLGVMGPRSRELLLRCTEADLSHEGFPFGAAREVVIGGVGLTAVRITYVGELGWELHLPMEGMPAVYDALWSHGQDLGLSNAGHYAINSLRLEKGYRAWGHELSPDDTPLEAGLSFAVAWDKAGGFLGRDALLEQKQAGVGKRMASFVLDDAEPALWGSETIFRDGELVGYTTSGSYGHAVGGAVAMGYVRRPDGVASPAWVREGRYEIENDGERHAATVHLRAPWDPKRERILC